MTLTAGPGFGKTTLLAAALADARPEPTDSDVWLACEPADEDAELLLAGLAAAAGLEQADDVGDLVRELWGRAPARTCFVLDDVHEIPDGSSGARLLADLCDRLPSNVTFVLSSRARPPFPIPLARLTAAGRWLGIDESALLFTSDELREFAALRGVDGAVVNESGGWPALAELAAAASDDAVFEYVWDVVLDRIGPVRTGQLARLAVVGGGDREILEATTGAAVGDPVLRGVPLVDVRRDGWIIPHRLWEPIARRTLAPDELRAARVAAARVHVRRGRFERAADLYTDAEAWDELLAMIRHVAVDHGALDHGHRVGTWRRRLPTSMQSSAVGRLAEGMELASRVPLDAEKPFVEAALAFRSSGDVDAEIATMERLGVVRWWANDVAGMWELYQRTLELSQRGIQRAQVLTGVGTAAIAHLTGDPQGVIDALQPLGQADNLVWSPSIWWFRHVAHRRLGDIERAELALLEMDRLPGGKSDPQVQMCQLRTDWLLGKVDGVGERMAETAEHYTADEHRYLRSEARIEAASRLAWLGDRSGAVRLLDQVLPRIDAAPGPLVRILRLIAEVAIAIDADDEDTAREMIADEELARPGRVESWYWYDRAAVAVLHQLVPADRSGWAAEAAAPLHRLGVELSNVLASVRAGDMAPMRSMIWPEPGLVRAHLPARWIAELVDAGTAVGNMAPIELSRAVSQRSVTIDAPAIEIRVLGPLTVRRDGTDVDHADLRRVRVRELLALLAAGPVRRREELADLIWPDHPDPRQNLRVTLSYVRRILLADAGGSTGDAVLVADHEVVRLLPGQRLGCDLWEFEAHLRAAASAERVHDPARALESYAEALSIWCGVPFVDVVGSDELAHERQRLVAQFAQAAVRAGDLWLADGHVSEALQAGHAVLAVDATSESAHRLVARSHLAAGDVAAAGQVLRRCLEVLDELGVHPSEATTRLVSELAGSAR